MAPEILLGQPACENADCWAFGILTAEILCGVTPVNDDGHGVQELVRNILHAVISLPEHEHIGEEESDLILSLLCRDQFERLGSRDFGGFESILAHSWFRAIPIRDILYKQLRPPWIPHLNGPPDDAILPPPTSEHAAEAAFHGMVRTVPLA